MSTVDVIVPCYRYGHFLRQAVDSVLEQGASVRVLIIDDASPDDSAEVAADIARSDPRVTFIHHQQNKGHILTYNEGIEWVAADYMLLLSADDYLLPGALGRATGLMDQHPEVGFTYGNAVELVERPGVKAAAPMLDLSEGSTWRIMPGIQFIEACGAKNIVRTPTAVVRTSLQKRVGGYRTELPHSGDMEMWFRLAAYGSVGVCEAKQAVYRSHAANMSISYMTRSALPDLLQRKAAIDAFLHACEPVLPKATQLRERLLMSLAYEAVGCASGAFNDADLALSSQIADFATEVSPGVRRSAPWVKLLVKRAMGPQMWRKLSAGARRDRAV